MQPPADGGKSSPRPRAMDDKRANSWRAGPPRQPTMPPYLAGRTCRLNVPEGSPAEVAGLEVFHFRWRRTGWTVEMEAGRV